MRGQVQATTEQYPSAPGSLGRGTLGHPKGGSEWRWIARFRPAMVEAVLLLVMVLGSRTVWAQRDNKATGPEEKPPAPAPAPKRPAAEVPPPPGMSYSTHLDHTALWVGDQFHYTIIVDYSPNYEFVVDNLGKETVNMDPFQVVDVGKKTVSLKNGTKRLFLDITLSSFATGKNVEQIPQLTLFYFRRDRHTAGAPEAAAESLTVPGPAIGLRTTLPPNPNDIRDAIAVSGWARSRWVVAGAGWVSLVILVAGLGWETALLVRRRKLRRGPDRRKAMEAVRARWASSVPADFSNAPTVLEFYDRCYENLKEYLGYYLETPVTGLTSEELQTEMQRLGTDRDFTQKVVTAVGSLETARYAQNGTTPTPEVAQNTAQQVREIFSVGSKR